MNTFNTFNYFGIIVIQHAPDSFEAIKEMSDIFSEIGKKEESISFLKHFISIAENESEDKARYCTGNLLTHLNSSSEQHLSLGLFCTTWGNMMNLSPTVFLTSKIQLKRWASGSLKYIYISESTLTIHRERENISGPRWPNQKEDLSEMLRKSLTQAMTLNFYLTEKNAHMYCSKLSWVEELIFSTDK